MTDTPPAQARTTIAPLVWKISAGALIPSFATIIFNILNFFFENYQISPMPHLQHSVFDIGVGCAFALVGVCVATKDHALTNTFLIVFVFLLLIILGGQVLVVLLQWSKLVVVWVTNAICFVALSWAIIEAD
jgi:hypothetical protein